MRRQTKSFGGIYWIGYSRLEKFVLGDDANHPWRRWGNGAIENERGWTHTWWKIHTERMAITTKSGHCRSSAQPKRSFDRLLALHASFPAATTTQLRHHRRGTIWSVVYMFKRSPDVHNVFILLFDSTEQTEGANERGLQISAIIKNEIFQCFILHDVDMLPERDGNPYTCPEDGRPRQMAFSVDYLKNYS